jgi:hypothetical protein
LTLNDNNLLEVRDSSPLAWNGDSFAVNGAGLTIERQRLKGTAARYFVTIRLFADFSTSDTRGTKADSKRS